MVDPDDPFPIRYIGGKTRDELYRIYLNCLQTGMDFRLTAVPREMRGLNSVIVDLKGHHDSCPMRHEALAR